MSRYAQPMSQTLAEMKMNDPKLNKIFDKLKKGSTVKIKHSSTLEKGNIVKVTFGDPNIGINRDAPEARKHFRA